MCRPESAKSFFGPAPTFNTQVIHKSSNFNLELYHKTAPYNCENAHNYNVCVLVTSDSEFNRVEQRLQALREDWVAGVNID